MMSYLFNLGAMSRNFVIDPIANPMPLTELILSLLFAVIGAIMAFYTTTKERKTNILKRK
jgi:hypothetical protein